jgi:Acyl-protein synthetase, LuxE
MGGFPLLPRASNDERLETLVSLHERLLAAAREWSRGEEPPLEVESLRHEAIRVNHLRYGDLIPYYRHVAEGQDQLGPIGVDAIIQNLMFPGLFKTYERRWLEERDFESLTVWLGNVSTRRAEIDLDDVADLNGWRQRLRSAGFFLTYSSGTSGHMSIVPRDRLSWKALCTNSSAYADPTWSAGEGGAARPFDCLVAGPRGGGLGILGAGVGLARSAARAHFLYDVELPDELVPGAAEEASTRGALTKFLDAAGAAEGDHYGRAFDFLRQSIRDARPVLIFGAPFQIKWLCEALRNRGETLDAPPGSTVVTGGGWKSFGGERIAQAELRRLVREAFGIDRDRFIDAYSTTELNCTLSSCREGRYHVPPLIEPVVLDEALMGAAGQEGNGTLGFLDPFAVSYPGFVITGDQGRLARGRCPCGLSGWFIDGEIERSADAEIKGCGGVLASVRA